MRISISGTVIDVFEGKNKTYVQLNDAEVGGMCKLGFPSPFDVKLNQQVSFDAIVKPGMGQYGLSLNVEKILPKGDKNN